jgi:hypothetical protein
MVNSLPEYIKLPTYRQKAATYRGVVTVAFRKIGK